MWRRKQCASYLRFFGLMVTLCLLPSCIYGSLLKGGGHHHHHHHEHSHDEGDMQHHNNGSHKEHHTSENKLPFPNSPKQESKEPTKIRRGRKFSSTGTKNKKSFDRPLPFRIPRTSFSCKGRAPGYYADMEADCQVYRMCTARGGGQAFLCPEATRFSQRTLVCDHAYRVKCSDSSSFFHRNLIIHEESMKATTTSKLRNFEQAKLRNKGKKKPLRKRPRLQSTKITNINPRPNVIRTGRLNGRLSFAPLFEKKRKENFEKFSKALDMTAPVRIVNRFKTKRPRRPVPSAGKSFNNFSTKTEFKKSKPKEVIKKVKNQSNQRNRNKDEDSLLGLPELPPDIGRHSPIFTIKARPHSVSFLNSKGSNENSNEEVHSDGQVENVEVIGGQLLPPVAAGKSVAKFHKDREAPTNSQLSVFLTPPPPLPTADPIVPLQLVGHVITSNELSAFPDSPIVNIKKVASDEGQIGTISNHFNLSTNGRNKISIPGRKVFRNGRLKSKQKNNRSRPKGRSHGEEVRSSRIGQSVGLPIQLKPSGRGMPAPLVWISPASLARSPMVSLRTLERPNHNELFKSGNVERALTMTFPGRSTRRFDPQCLECMSIKHSDGICPPCFISLR